LEERNLLSFLPPVSYRAGPFADAVAVGDFTGNGIPDLAVANGATNGTVSILVGKGDGSFRAPLSYPVGNSPRAVAVGDFNGDGHLDLAVVNWYSRTVSVLLGNGNGTFQAVTNYAVGNDPDAVAVGDFTGDGILDLAVANRDSDTVSVLLGNGDGSFQARTDYPVGVTPFGLAVGDFDGDGTADLAVAAHGVPRHGTVGDVSVLLANGDGTFRPAQHYTADHNPTAVAVGDFSGNGALDLAVANEYSNDVSILVGNGDGSFQAPQDYAVGADPYSVAVGDFTRNGTLGLAVADGGYGGSNDVSVLLGNGDGTFQAAQRYPAGPSPLSVAVGDFNGDGFPDLALANGGQGTVTILLNAGDWRGRPPAAPAQRSTPTPYGEALGQPPWIPRVASVVAYDPQAPTPFRPTADDLAPKTVLSLPTADEGQPARVDAAFLPTPRAVARNGEDTMLGKWGDARADLPFGTWPGQL
jgi:hypothetical protein